MTIHRKRNTDVNRCSSLLNLRAMQIKTSLRHHFSPNRLLKIKSWEIHCWQAFGQTGVLIPGSWEFRLEEELYQKHSLLLKHPSMNANHVHIDWHLSNPYICPERHVLHLYFWDGETDFRRHWRHFSGDKSEMTQALLSTNTCSFPQPVFSPLLPLFLPAFLLQISTECLAVHRKV